MRARNRARQGGARPETGQEPNFGGAREAALDESARHFVFWEWELGSALGRQC
jgi:hypothetical protein